jgi:hypothetical protein
MAGVATRPLLQIILVLWLCFPEIPNGFDFGDHLAVSLAQTGYSPNVMTLATLSAPPERQRNSCNGQRG